MRCDAHVHATWSPSITWTDLRCTVGELDGLVAALGPGVRLTASFYDRSNWCVEFERTAEAL